MTLVRNDALNLALDTGYNPYLMDGYAPVHTEIDAEDLQVIGEIPSDLNGLYVRNGPNPMYSPLGRYHWFDGDGTLHTIHFRAPNKGGTDQPEDRLPPWGRCHPPGRREGQRSPTSHL